jgi:hypothetical protein
MIANVMDKYYYLGEKYCNVKLEVICKGDD